MCLITVYNPQQANFEDVLAVAKAASVLNDDGWGIMYHNNDKVCTHRGMDSKELYNLLEKLNSTYTDADIDIYIHQRMATAGLVNLDNTHPFQIGDTGWHFMHNGVMENFYGNQIQSDTSVFCDYLADYLKEYPESLFDNAVLKLLALIGGDSRFVFLHDDGSSVIFGNYGFYSYKNMRLSNLYACFENANFHLKQGRVLDEVPLKKPFYTNTKVYTAADVLSDWESCDDYIENDFDMKQGDETLMYVLGHTKEYNEYTGALKQW